MDQEAGQCDGQTGGASDNADRPELSSRGEKGDRRDDERGLQQHFAQIESVPLAPRQVNFLFQVASFRFNFFLLFPVTIYFALVFLRHLGEELRVLRFGNREQIEEGLVGMTPNALRLKVGPLVGRLVLQE